MKLPGRFILLLCFVLTFSASQGQTTVYRDTTCGYEISYPSWFKLYDTPEGVFGGELPAADTVPNTVLIKSYSKTAFHSLSEFENWVIKDYTVGQESRWDPGTVLLLKKQVLDFPVPGLAWSVQELNGGMIYNCFYLLTESSKGYIWAEYSATRISYDQNYGRFLELIKTLQLN